MGLMNLNAADWFTPTVKLIDADDVKLMFMPTPYHGEIHHRSQSAGRNKDRAPSGGQNGMRSHLCGTDSG
jgi:hypothetical protein